MFKVDDEFQGRGTAYLSLENVRVLSEIFRGDKEINEEIVQKIREVVANLLPSKLRFAQPSLYLNFTEYI